MYVSQYTRIAMVIPLTFVEQTVEVQKKRRLYLYLIGLIEVTVYGAIIINMIVEEAKRSMVYNPSAIMFNVFAVIMTVALYFSLRTIR